MNNYQPTSDLRIIRGAAARIGCDVEEYRARRAAGEKWCGQCRSWHVAADFSANRSNRDGLANMCRACKGAYDVAYNRQRYAPANNAERCQAQRQARKARDPDFPARERARVAAVRAGRTAQQAAHDRIAWNHAAQRDTTPRPAPPAAPPAPAAPPVATQDAAGPRTRVAAITDAWDARLQERALRRAERRGAG